MFAAKSAEAERNAEMLGLMVNDPDIDVNELHKITIKTLVIAGTRDMIKTKHTQKIYEALPNAKIVFVPGNHFIANKNPAAFNRAVEEFLLSSV